MAKKIGKISDKQIASRCSQAVAYKETRRKLYNYRRLTAGDGFAIAAAMEDALSAPNSPSKLAALGDGDNLEFGDVLVSNIQEGRSNKLMQAVRALVLQTSMSFPEANFEDLESNLATLNAQYFTSRSSMCDVVTQARSVALDYCICGLGVAYIGMRDDYPVVDRLNILDVIWDKSSTSFSGIKWASWIIRRPLEEWLELFPNSDKFDAMSDDLDLIVPVVVYYDRVGENGNCAYFLSTSMNSSGVNEDDLIERMDNPYKAFVNGSLQPIVPLQFMENIQFPGVDFPSGTVEMMLPAQCGIWQKEEAIGRLVDKSNPIYQAEQGAFEQTSLDAWESSETDILYYKNGKSGLTMTQPISIDNALLNEKNSQEREIIAMSGVNPYQSGNPVQGIKFAAETNAIQGAAGLVAGNMAKDVKSFWEGLISKYIAVGSMYDDMPITLMFRSANDAVELHFDESDPITHYLKPASRVSVNEDTLLYQPKDQRIARAVANLQLAMSLAQQYPAFLQKAMEDYLRATGVKDVASYFEAPAISAPQATTETTQAPMG